MKPTALTLIAIFLAISFLAADPTPPHAINFNKLRQEQIQPINSLKSLELLSQALANSSDPTVQASILRGMKVGLEGKSDLPAPLNWTEALNQLTGSDKPEIQLLTRSLNQLFGGQDATAYALLYVGNTSSAAFQADNSPTLIKAEATDPTNGKKSFTISLLDSESKTSAKAVSANLPAFATNAPCKFTHLTSKLQALSTVVSKSRPTENHPQDPRLLPPPRRLDSPYSRRQRHHPGTTRLLQRSASRMAQSRNRSYPIRRQDHRSQSRQQSQQLEQRIWFLALRENLHQVSFFHLRRVN